MRTKTITIYNVKFRPSGEDYEVFAFRTLEAAEEFATNFLQGFLWNAEWEATLEQLEIYCANNDLAYIDITKHVI